METTKAETVELELTTGEAYGAWAALRPLSMESLSVKAALKVRRIHRDLFPFAKDREEVEQQILKDYGGKVDEVGRVTGWDNPKGAEEMKALNKETVTINVVPLTFDELDGDGVKIQPAALMQLEDAGILKE